MIIIIGMSSCSRCFYFKNMLNKLKEEFSYLDDIIKYIDISEITLTPIFRPYISVPIFIELYNGNKIFLTRREIFKKINLIISELKK